MTRLAALAAALTLLLAGCSGSDDAPAATPAATPTTVNTKAVAMQAAITALRKQYPAYESVADDRIATLLQANCDSFDDGTTWLQAVKILTDTGVEAREAGVLLGTSVYALCPEHRDLLPGQ